MLFTNTTHTATSQTGSHPAGPSGSVPSNSNAPAAQTYAGELYYGIGRFLRNQWDYLYQTFWKDSGPSPEEMARKQRDIYVAGLKKCIEHLKPALENVRKNPHDSASLGKIDNLAQHYAAYVNVAPSMEWNLYQQQLFQPIREQVERLNNPSLQRKLKMLLPVLAMGFLEQENQKSGSPVEDGNEYSIGLSQSSYDNKESMAKNPSHQKRHVEQISPPPLNVVNLPLDNQVQDMVIQNGYAYTVNGQVGLKILDVSNPNNVRIVSQYDTPGDAQRIVYDNGYVYIADGAGGMQIVNVKNASNPIFSGLWMTGINAPVIDIAVINGKAYIADGTNTLTEIDVSVPESVYQAIVPGGISSGLGRGVAVSGNIIYVAGGSLYVMNISNVMNPKLLGALSTSYSESVAVSGNRVYVAARSSGLYVVDVSNATSPKLLGTLPTSYARDVAVSGNTAYVADMYDGLYVVDVSNETNPMPLSVLPMTSAQSVAVLGNTVYVADFDNLRLINVSNATNPTLLGTLPTKSANSVTVSGNIAYVADTQGGLRVVDVSNATNLKFLGTFPTTRAQGVAVLNNTAYVADYTSGLRVVDVSNATNPKLLNTFPLPTWTYGVAVSGNIAYVATGDGLRIIQVNPLIILNTYTFRNPILQLKQVNNILWIKQSVGFQAFNPMVPILSTHFSLTDSRDVSVLGNSAYVADDTSGLRVVDVSNATNPKLLSTLPLSRAHGLAVFGNTTYVADDISGLHVVDVSNATSPKLLGTLSTASARDVVFLNNTAYVADWTSLRVVDVSNTTNPRFVGMFPTAQTESVAVSGDVAYVTDGNYGFHLVDVSNMTNPKLLSTLPTTYTIMGIAISDNMAYVAGLTSGLLIIDVSNATNPKLLSTFPTPFTRGVAVSGGMVYVADGTSGLRVVDVSNATNPALLYQFGTLGDARKVAVSANRVYVACSTGLAILDMTLLPWFPFQELSSAFLQEMQVVAPYAFITSNSTLEIWNITDPTQARRVGSWNTSFATNHIDVVGNHIFLGNAGGITVLDISNPIFPQVTNNYICVQSVESFVVDNGILYLPATYQCRESNLIPCPRSQSLTIRNYNVQVNKGQNLRLTPNDLLVSCENSTTLNFGTLFNITGVNHAQFQTRNASGFWNNVSSFLGKDIAHANVAFIHDNSTFAPELNISVTDGQTTLTSAVTVYFNTSQSTPRIENIGFSINANGTTALTVDQFQITTDTDTKLANVVIFVTSSQEGYFTTTSDPTQPISDFTYYQLQNGQIQFVHNGAMLPQVTLSVGDGSGQPVLVRPLISFFDTNNNPASPSVPIAAVVGSAVGALVAIGLGVFGIFKYRQHQEQEENVAQSAGQRLR